MSTHDTDDHDQRTDLSIMSQEEYKQKRRLKSILDGIEKVEDVDDTAKRMFYRNEISREARDILVLEAVRELIRECWTLLLDHYDETENDEYLVGRTIGAVELEHEDDSIVIEGLADFLHCQRQYTETWTEEVPWRHGEDVVKEHTKTHVIPRDVTWEAYLLLRTFLAEEANIALSVEETERPHAAIS